MYQKLLNFLQRLGFGRANSVSQDLAALTEAREELRKTASNRRAAAAQKRQQISKLLAEKDADVSEAEKAQRVINKLGNLLE